jgi:TM2 domain-containing membrane protein YozV
MTTPQPPYQDPGNPAPPPPPYPPQTPYQAPPPYQPMPQYLADAHSKKMLAGLMGIFLGPFGVHKFILGYTTAGVITIVVSVVGICPFLLPGLLAMRIITLIEGIMYLTKTDEEFYQMYIAQKKEWF